MHAAELLGVGLQWRLPVTFDFRSGAEAGSPIVGATSYGNLHTNTGHGTLGWTMACGSARVLADVISARPPEIDASDLALGRYSDRRAQP